MTVQGKQFATLVTHWDHISEARERERGERSREALKRPREQPLKHFRAVCRGRAAAASRIHSVRPLAAVS